MSFVIPISGIGGISRVGKRATRITSLVLVAVEPRPTDDESLLTQHRFECFRLRFVESDREKHGRIDCYHSGSPYSS
jgi:hypothetical protein